MTNVPLPVLPPIHLKSKFEDIFASTNKKIRRARWAQWVRIARKHSPESARYWQSKWDCWCDGGCRYLRGRWCQRVSLPASVNPLLSFEAGISGMACCGLGRVPLDADVLYQSEKDRRRAAQEDP